MAPPRRMLVMFAAACVLLAPARYATAQDSEAPPEIPANATAIEGTPSVKIETTADGTTTHRILADAESLNASLKIDVVDGLYYRAGERSRPLNVSRSGEFIYLTSNEPGHYIRFTEINGTLRYVEHVDIELGSVTYWGELRFVLGRSRQ